MHRHKHLWEQVVRFENLYAAAREAWRGKRGKLPGARFFAEVEKELASLEEELRSGTYRPRPYTYFIITDPKERQVGAAAFRDRVVHHALVRVIEPLFDRRFISHSFACRRGKGTHAALEAAVGFARCYPYALKCDIQKYFPSIDHEILLRQIGRVIGDRQVLALVRLILESHQDGQRMEWPDPDDLLTVRVCKRGLPIGNLTSQFFANVYLDELDQFVKQQLRVRGYVRYVDDFILFGEDRATLRAQGRAIREKLTALRLRIHPDKYRLLPTRLGVEFVGFVVRADGRCRVRRASVRRFARRYQRMRWEARHGWRDWREISVSVRAWVAHVSHAQSYGLRRDVLAA